MKTLRILLVFILVSSCILSCSDDDPGAPAGTAVVTANVDGSAWASSPDGPHSPVGAVGLVNTSSNIILQAYAADGSYMSLNTISTSAISETSYSSSTGEFQAQFKNDFLGSELYTSTLGGGTITFTNISSENLAGTFSFNGVNASFDTVVITNGVFNVDL